MSKDRPWLTGKPKLDPAIKRSKVMNFSVTESEQQNLKTLAQMYNMKPAQLVHVLICNKLQEEEKAIQLYKEAHQAMKGI